MKIPKPSTRRNKKGVASARRGTEKGARQSRIGLLDRVQSYFAHHRVVAKDSLMRLLRAWLPSLMTWMVIAIALALPLCLYVLLQNVHHISGDWDRAVQLSVFLEAEVEEPQALRLAESIEARADVELVRYVSPQAALDEFQAQSGFGDALSYLDANPLPPVLIIELANEARAMEEIEALLKALRSLAGVELVQVDLEWVQRLYEILSFGEKLVIALGALLALAVLLVIGNTIRLLIESRREEIIVVKLVGGTNSFVRRPFLYTGIWYGLGGGLIAYLIINLVLIWLSGPIVRLVAAYQTEFSLQGLGFVTTLLLLFASAILGLIGSWLSVAKHLRQIEPH